MQTELRMKRTSRGGPRMSLLSPVVRLLLLSVLCLWITPSSCQEGEGEGLAVVCDDGSAEASEDTCLAKSNQRRRRDLGVVVVGNSAPSDISDPVNNQYEILFKEFETDPQIQTLFANPEYKSYVNFWIDLLNSTDDGTVERILDSIPLSPNETEALAMRNKHLPNIGHSQLHKLHAHFINLGGSSSSNGNSSSSGNSSDPLSVDMSVLDNLKDDDVETFFELGNALVVVLRKVELLEELEVEWKVQGGLSAEGGKPVDVVAMERSLTKNGIQDRMDEMSEEDQELEEKEKEEEEATTRREEKLSEPMKDDGGHEFKVLNEEEDQSVADDESGGEHGGLASLPDNEKQALEEALKVAVTQEAKYEESLEETAAAAAAVATKRSDNFVDDPAEEEEESQQRSTDGSKSSATTEAQSSNPGDKEVEDHPHSHATAYPVEDEISGSPHHHEAHDYEGLSLALTIVYSILFAMSIILLLGLLCKRTLVFRIFRRSSKPKYSPIH